MAHHVFLVQDPDQRAAFSGLILPEIQSRLGDPTVFLVGAVEGQQPVGAAVLELESGRAQLLSIAVAEDKRRRGIGLTLLRHCVRTLRRTSIQTLYAVLTAGEEAAEGLLQAFGMESSGPSGAHYSFTAAVAANHAILRGPKPGCFPLESVSTLHFRSYLHKAFPLDPAAVKREEFDPKISQVLVENGKITGCVLAEWEPDGLSLGWFSSFSGDKWALLYLLRGIVAACPSQTQLHFAAYDPLVVQLADKLLGTAAKRLPIRQWTLADRRFRMADTAPTQWEEDDKHEHES